MVNGKNISEAFNMVSVFEEPTHVKKMGGKEFPYYSVKDYETRLNAALGPWKARVFFPSVTPFSVHEQAGVLVTCHIDVYDDEDHLIYACEGVGTKEFVPFKDKPERFMNIEQAAHNASVAAFKSACKWLGVFGVYDNEAEEAPKASKPSKTAPAPKKPAEKKEDAIINFVTDGAFYSVGEKDGAQIWKIAGSDKADKQDGEVIFYPNQYKKDTDKFNRLYSAVSKKSTLLRIKVRPSGVKDAKNQFVFLGFAS